MPPEPNPNPSDRTVEQLNALVKDVAQILDVLAQHYAWSEDSRIPLALVAMAEQIDQALPHGAHGRMDSSLRFNNGKTYFSDPGFRSLLVGAGCILCIAAPR